MEALEKYIESLKEEIPELTSELGEFQSRAEKTATSFVDECKEDLDKWTKALIKGELSKKDFEWLVKSKKNLLKLNSLKAAGLAKIEVEKFGNKLISLTISKAAELIQN